MKLGIQFEWAKLIWFSKLINIFEGQFRNCKNRQWNNAHLVTHTMVIWWCFCIIVPPVSHSLPKHDSANAVLLGRSSVPLWYRPVRIEISVALISLKHFYIFEFYSNNIDLPKRFGQKYSLLFLTVCQILSKFVQQFWPAWMINIQTNFRYYVV